MPGSVNANLAQDLIAAFREALEPLIDILGDPAARRAVLEDLGLDPDAAGPPQLDAAVRDRVAQYVASVDQDLQAFDGVAHDITLILDAVRGVIEVANTGNAAVADELLHHLLVLAGTSFVRYRVRRLYWFARLLGLIEEKITTEATGGQGLFSNLLVVGVGTLQSGISNLFDSLEDEHDAVLLTRAILEPLGMIIALLPALRSMLEGLGISLSNRRRQVILGWEPTPGSPTPVADAIADPGTVHPLRWSGNRCRRQYHRRQRHPDHPVRAAYVPWPGNFPMAGR